MKRLATIIVIIVCACLLVACQQLGTFVDVMMVSDMHEGFVLADTNLSTEPVLTIQRGASVYISECSYDIVWVWVNQRIVSVRVPYDWRGNFSFPDCAPGWRWGS